MSQCKCRQTYVSVEDMCSAKEQQVLIRDVSDWSLNNDYNGNDLNLTISEHLTFDGRWYEIKKCGKHLNTFMEFEQVKEFIEEYKKYDHWFKLVNQCSNCECKKEISIDEIVEAIKKNYKITVKYPLDTESK